MVNFNKQLRLLVIQLKISTGCWSFDSSEYLIMRGIHHISLIRALLVIIFLKRFIMFRHKKNLI